VLVVLERIFRRAGYCDLASGDDVTIEKMTAPAGPEEHRKREDGRYQPLSQTNFWMSDISTAL
jgi:hypothetical protein